MEQTEPTQSSGDQGDAQPMLSLGSVQVRRTWPSPREFERFAHAVKHAYERRIVEEGKQPQVIILGSFLVTFSTVRIITHDIRAGRHRGLLHNISGPGGTHIHHLVPGIFLLLTAGYLGIGLSPIYHREPHAVAYGVGAALTLDEFALWLHLQDVYWSQEGRESVDAVVIAATIGSLGVLGRGFLVDVGRAAGRLIGLHRHA